MKHLILRCSQTFTLCCISIFSLHADSGSWSIAAADLLWNNNANWTGASFPNGVSQAAAFIGAPGTTTIDSSEDITIGSLHFDVPGNSIFVGFTNNTLTFDKTDTPADEANIFIASSQSHFLNTPVVLNSDLTIHAGTSASLDLSQPISGNHSVTIMVDGSTHINNNATHTYTGGTFIASGYLDLNGPGQNIPGDVTIFGSGNLKHAPGTSNNYAANTIMTVFGGNVELNDTAQTLETLIMRQSSAVYSNVAPSSLTLTGTSPALQISGNSTLSIDRLILENGGTILNNSAEMGDGIFAGIAAPATFMTIDLNGNTNVRINADQSPLQGRKTFDIAFYNVEFMNGSLEKTGGGNILLAGDTGKNTLVDLNILNGTVQVGLPEYHTIIDGPCTIRVDLGGGFNGFATVGTNGNANLVNAAGTVFSGGIYIPGTLTISGNFEQQSQGALYIQGFDSTTINTLVVKDGTVSLDGEFHFLAVPGGLFEAGDEFVVIDNTGGSISGMFSTFSATLPAGLSATLIYTSTQVRIKLSACNECAECLLPPANLEVSTRVTSCVNQNDFVHQLSWTASPSSHVSHYNVYVNGFLAGHVDILHALTFTHHYNPSAGSSYEYHVTAVRQNGEESAAVSITV